MCAHNMKVAGVNNPQKACEIAQILYILILNMQPIKLQCISTEPYFTHSSLTSVFSIAVAALLDQTWGP